MMATVEMVSPAGNPEIVAVSDRKAFLDMGYVLRDAAWKEQQDAIALQQYEAWLAEPESLAERFQMLRQMRDMKIAATDYLLMPDYPISAEQKAAVEAYRKALRDLPAQEGAPWDGGGKMTPWPEMPE